MAFGSNYGEGFNPGSTADGGYYGAGSPYGGGVGGDAGGMNNQGGSGGSGGGNSGGSDFAGVANRGTVPIDPGVTIGDAINIGGEGQMVMQNGSGTISVTGVDGLADGSWNIAANNPLGNNSSWVSFTSPDGLVYTGVQSGNGADAHWAVQQVYGFIGPSDGVVVAGGEIGPSIGVVDASPGPVDAMTTITSGLGGGPNIAQVLAGSLSANMTELYLLGTSWYNNLTAGTAGTSTYAASIVVNTSLALANNIVAAKTIGMNLNSSHMSQYAEFARNATRIASQAGNSAYVQRANSAAAAYN